MKKSLLIIGIVLALISLCFAADLYIVRGGWYRTAAEVEFIGLPDGIVFGSYTDRSGIPHSGEKLFASYLAQGHTVRVEQYYGRSIDIIINTDNGEIASVGLMTLLWAAPLTAAATAFAALLLLTVRDKYSQKNINR